MKKVFILLSVAALAACVSCSNFKGGVEYTDKSAEYQQSKGSLEEKSFESPADPVQIVSDANAPKFVWETGDAVTIFDGKQSYKFTVNADGSVVSFDGEAYDASEVYAVYPYNPEVSFVDGKVKMPVSNNQYLVEGSIAKANNILIGHAASLKSVGAIDFKSALAYVKFTVDLDESPKSIQLTTKGGEPLAGSVNIKLDDLTAEFAEGTSSVNLLSNEFDGTYYVAVAPQTYSEGLILLLTSRKGLVASVKYPDVKAAAAGEVIDLGTIDGDKVYYPSNVQKTSVFRAKFATDEFNMISEPGFEEYPSVGILERSRWMSSVQWDGAHPSDVVYGGIETNSYFPNHQSHSGSYCAHIRTIPIFGTMDRGWNLMEQTIALSPKTNYTFSAWVDANNMDCYMGVNAKGVANAGHEIPGNTWTQNGAYNNVWKNVTLDFNSDTDFFGYVFFGDWGEGGTAGWPNGGWYNTLYVDDVKVIPTGYTLTSTKPAGLEKKGKISNVTKTVADFGKYICWLDGNNLYAAFASPKVGASQHENAVAVAEDVNFASGIVLSDIAATDVMTVAQKNDDRTNEIILNGGFSANGKMYVHYAEKFDGDITIPNTGWAVGAYGFIVSEDGGKTWTKCSNALTAADGSWWDSQAGFCVNGDYVYMVSCWPGRTRNVEDAFFVSRSLLSNASIEDFRTWECWNGSEWAVGLRPNDVGNITRGSMSEPAIIYNPKFERYMMFYRSEFHQGIVYRDAAEPQGPWSGEKILTDDLADGVFYAPSALKVDADGSVWLTLSEF